MHQTRKGQQWYFGMKLHIGVDSQTWTDAQRGGNGCQCARQASLARLATRQRAACIWGLSLRQSEGVDCVQGPETKDFTNQRTRYNGMVDQAQRAKNRNKSKIRARVEHVFGVVKRLWGFTKVRYRGLQKNATRAFTALALANIYLSRGYLHGQVRP